MSDPTPIILLTPEQAELALGLKGTGGRTMRKWRNRDSVRIRQGLAPLGPRWVNISHSCVRYRLSDLEEFVAERSGYVSSAGAEAEAEAEAR
jgi:hypothetical protein